MTDQDKNDRSKPENTHESAKQPGGNKTLPQPESVAQDRPSAKFLASSQRKGGRMGRAGETADAGGQPSAGQDGAEATEPAFLKKVMKLHEAQKRRQPAQEQDSKVAARRIKPSLPVAKPVLPEEDETDGVIQERFGQQEKAAGRFIPDVSDDPDVREAKEAAEKAQAELERVEMRKKMMRMVMDSADLDPENVEQICEAEPWKEGDLMNLSVRHFGFVPQKFEYLADQHAEGSPEHERYIDARDEAYKIYHNQIRSAARTTVAKLRDTYNTETSVRAAAESINARINSFRHRASLEEDPMTQYQSAALMCLMNLIGHHVMQNGSSSRLTSGEGYRQCRMTLTND